MFPGEKCVTRFAHHNAFTVGEVFDEKRGRTAGFPGDNGYFSTMFDFRAHEFGKSARGWYDRTDITPTISSAAPLKANAAPAKSALRTSLKTTTSRAE